MSGRARVRRSSKNSWVPQSTNAASARQRPRCCFEVARAVTGPARPSRAWIGFDGVFEVKVPACTSSVEPTFTMERTRTQPNSRTLAQSPWTFSSAPAAGVSNSTREASVKSRPSLSFLYAIPPRSVQDHDLAAAGEEREHFEIVPFLVLSLNRGGEVQHEGRVHGAKRLSGEIEGARLPEHAVGEDVDTPPARRRRPTEHVEGRLLGQLPHAHLGELRGDQADDVTCGGASHTGDTQS